MTWYSVRHVLQNQGSFEERVTLWEARSFDEAIAMAEAEAADYACVVLHDGKALDFFQAYELPEPPGHGQEAFSLIRESSLSADEYVVRFFATGAELERDSDSPSNG